MKWLEIGTFTQNTNEVEIQLHEGFEKALIKLDLFSHCSLFFLQKDRIEVRTAHIRELRQPQGQISLSLIEESNALNTALKGQLVDIKPYFPSEEVIENAASPENRFCINYTGDSIGRYLLHGQRPVIQIQNPIQYKEELKRINKGDHLRVLWYLHRFDKDAFRKNRMCIPPYNDAPKTGVFATRSPVRPNPLAATNVQVQSVDHENGIIEILGFDGFEKSEIFQLMFYQPSIDRVKNAQLPSWVSHWTAYKKFEYPKEIAAAEIKGDFEAGAYFPELEANADIAEDVDTGEIHIHNARIHNLKNISVSIPKEKITIISGVSGSGKSSLAFDTVFAESQKQFMDLIMSNQMLASTFTDACVDKISGLQPSIAIAQRSLGANPRSTVGTVTRIAEVFKLLFSSLGTRLCPSCHNEVNDSNVCSSCGEILFDRTPQVFSYNHPDYMCPVCKGLGEELQFDTDLIVEHPEKSLLDSASSLYGDLRKHRKKPNANWMRGEILALALDMNVELDQAFKDLPDDFKQQFFYGSNGREVSLSYENTKGRSGVITRPVEGAVNLLSRLAHDSKSKRGMENIKRFMARKVCSRCNGERLREEGRMINIQGYRYPQIMNMDIKAIIQWCHNIYGRMTKTEKEIAKSMLSKIIFRLKRIEDVGINYVTLNRSIPSLSGGEAQRLKLATQFGTGLSDILYIMDEPSKGLHPRDYRFLMDAIVDLKNHGNTVILVEHKMSFLSIADKHIQMGPKAGRYGGEITLQQEGLDIVLTASNMLEDFEAIEINEDIDSSTNAILINGAKTNNLQDVNAVIPKQQMTAVIGVSGSGKSSLIGKTLYPRVLESLGKSTEEHGTCDSIDGIESFKDIHYVTQKAIGSNSRSTPGTYTGVFDLIRKCFSDLPDAIEQKMGKEHFSFNSKKGQCPECSGMGEVAVNMHYMEDLYIPCKACNGKRYNHEVLKIQRKGLSIGDILDMEINELSDIFIEENEIFQMLEMLEKVGLGYVKLGQSASSLSGGEAQRIKLAKELYRSDCSDVLYILDEPTTGLHPDDVDKIIAVLNELKEKGATLIIIEHNLRLIKECDYVLELGPGGGNQGGKIMRMGYQK